MQPHHLDAPQWADRQMSSYLVLSLQGHGIDLADVVGLGGGIIVVSVFHEVARAVVSEVGHCVVEKGNRPDKKGEEMRWKGRWRGGHPTQKTNHNIRSFRELLVASVTATCCSCLLHSSENQIRAE